MRRCLSLFVALLFLVTACGGSQKKTSAKYKKGSSTRYFPDGRYGSIDDVIYDNLEHRKGTGIYYSSELKTKKEFDIPYTYNRYVEKWMDYFTGRGRRHFARYLSRLGRFLPYIHAVAIKYGVPTDVVYLSMIESGFNVRAKSWASAVGPWQFIKSTGAMYGLNVDYYIDERRDVEKATHAAIRHLRDLYNEFGDWYLAFAAYNAGSGKVRGAIRRDGNNYWNMVRGRYLRQETKDYVPKIIAAAKIAKDPKKYGFTNIRYQRPIAYEVVRLKGPTGLEVAARCAGVDSDLIRLLNPELLQDMTPPHMPNYQLKIPHGTKNRFEKNYAKLKPSQRVQTLTYVAQRGDTVKEVASQFGVSQKELYESNRSRISKSSKRITKRYKVRYRRKGKRRYRWKKKRVTVASYSVKPGTQLVIPQSRSLKGYSSLRDDEAAHRAGDQFGMRMASADKVKEERKRSKKERKKDKKESKKVAKAEASKLQPLASASRVEENTPQAQAKSDLDLSDLALAESRRKPVTPTSFEGNPGSGQDNSPSEADLKEAVARLPAKSDSPDVSSDPENRTAWASEEELKARPEPAPQPKFHKVRRGETLRSIARKYGVSTKQLKAWNGKKVHPVLLAGARIKVGGQASVSPRSEQKPKDEFYKVKRGDSLGQIAQRFNVSRDELKDWNGKKVHPVLQAGAKIRVGGGPAVAAKSSPEKKKASTYKVKSGDTLSEVARAHGVSVKQLKAWNGKLVDPYLKAGTRISVNGPGKHAVPSVVKYKVKPGDSLYKIAKKHSTTPAKLKKLNGLKSTTIRPGAILVVQRK